MSRRLPIASGLVLSLVLGFTACGSDREPSTKKGPSSPSTAPKPTGSITVFAAASLTESFTDLQTRLKTSEPGVSVRYNFAGSGTLVTQIKQGAPADVIATADAASMKMLTEAGLVESPRTFARN